MYLSGIIGWRLVEVIKPGESAGIRSRGLSCRSAGTRILVGYIGENKLQPQSYQTVS